MKTNTKIFTISYLLIFSFLVLCFPHKTLSQTNEYSYIDVNDSNKDYMRDSEKRYKLDNKQCKLDNK